MVELTLVGRKHPRRGATASLRDNAAKGSRAVVGISCPLSRVGAQLPVECRARLSVASDATLMRAQWYQGLKVLEKSPKATHGKVQGRRADKRIGSSEAFISSEGGRDCMVESLQF